jgi:hypothetical protein
MLDVFTKMLSPDFLQQVTTFMTEWTSFMNRMGEKLKFIESQTVSTDNKVCYLVKEMDTANERLLWLMSETSITPELHGDVLQMAVNDPRNQAPLTPVAPDGFDYGAIAVLRQKAGY